MAGPELVPIDVQAVEGLVVSRTAAQLLVWALDELQRVAQPGRQMVEPLRLLRAQLAGECTRVSTRAYASPLASQSDTGRLWAPEVMSVREAAAALDLKEDSVRDLCRRDRLISMKFGGRVMISGESVRGYAESRRGV